MKSGTEVDLSCSVNNITAAVTSDWEDSSGEPVSSLSGDLENGVQVSTITVTATKEEKFTCYVADANSLTGVDKTVDLRIFGKKTFFK